MTLHDLTSQCYGGNISSGSASNKSGVVFKTDKTRVGLLIESKTTNDMDYDHSQSRFRLTEVQQAEYVSPLKQWFRKQNPLEQQAELEKDNMEHRPSRAVRYLNQRVFAVGETELAATKVEEKSVLEGAKIFGSSFLSGLVFMSFLSTPIGCLAHSLKGANMNSRTLFPDMVAAGLKTGLRSGVSYGALLATFRGANYALSGLHSDNQQTVTTITASGALGCAVGSIVYAGGLQRPMLVAGATLIGAGLFFSASQLVIESAYDDKDYTEPVEV